MDEELQKSVHMALDLVAVAALVMITAIMLRLAYAGWNDYHKMGALRTELSNKVEYSRYDEDLTPDTLINFIVTYGDQYVYFYERMGEIMTTANISPTLKNNVADYIDIVGKPYNTTKYIPLVSFELIDFFRDEITNVDPTTGECLTKFRLHPITFEGTELAMKDADAAQAMYIEEVH